MPWYAWPTGTPPYTADTHITDRTMNFMHDSIMSGVARDIAKIQYNINTTHLFASGWMWPVTNGWFQNIDASSLYVHNLYADNLHIHDLDYEHIDTITFSQAKNSDLNMYDTAIRDFDIPIQTQFSAGDTFLLNSGGFSYTGLSISGGIYDYLLASGAASRMRSLDIQRVTTLTSGCFKLLNTRTHRVILENMTELDISGSMAEGRIFWNSYGGHDHTRNKIRADKIQDMHIDFTDGMNIRSKNFDLQVVSGKILSENYVLSDYYESTDFLPVEGIENAVYKDPYANVSGYVRDMDIGTDHMVSYNGRVYASSYKYPSGHAGAPSGIRTNYIYETEDFHSWNAWAMSGCLTDGSGRVRGLSVYDNDIWVLVENQKLNNKYDLVVQTFSDRNDMTAYWWSGGYGSRGFWHDASPHPIGMDVTYSKLWIYGFTGTHTISGGYPHVRWDDTSYGPPGLVGQNDTNAVSGILSLSGSIEYNKPFLMYKDSDTKYAFTDHFSGSGPIANFRGGTASGIYADLFGNGFNEVTSLVRTTGRYFGGKKRYFGHRSQADDYVHTPLLKENIDTWEPLLIFGNAYLQTHTSGGNYVLFGGNVPLVLNVLTPELDIGTEQCGLWDDRIAPLHGGRSLYSERLACHFSDDFFGAVGADQWHLYPTYTGKSARVWTADHTESQVILRDAEVVSYITTPLCASGRLHYMHEHETTWTRIAYSDDPASGIYLASGFFPETFDKVTYYDRPNRTGFWSTKTFDWYYTYPSGENSVYEPPSGSMTKTYYYCQPTCPVQYNGKVYAALKYETGFVHIGTNGPEHIDDGIMYTDLLEYEGNLYGVGNEIKLNKESLDYDYYFTVRQFKGRSTTALTVPIGDNLIVKKAKMVIHNNNLYVGLGDGKFLVKKPSHGDMNAF